MAPKSPNFPPELTLANLGAGALMECATVELRKICENIADPNVKKDAKRKLSITIVVKPDEKGEMAAISYDLKTSCPGPDAGRTMAYIAKTPGSRDIGLFEVETHPSLFAQAEQPASPTLPFQPAVAQA